MTSDHCPGEIRCNGRHQTWLRILRSPQNLIFNAYVIILSSTQISDVRLNIISLSYNIRDSFSVWLFSHGACIWFYFSKCLPQHLTARVKVVNHSEVFSYFFHRFSRVLDIHGLHVLSCTIVSLYVDLDFILYTTFFKMAWLWSTLLICSLFTRFVFHIYISSFEYNSPHL